MISVNHHNHNPAQSRSGAEFDQLVALIGERFRALGTRPIFRTITDPDELWRVYLASFPPAERQWHNCHACRRFIRQFGGLAVVEPDGTIEPAVFGGVVAPVDFPTYAPGIRAMQRLVRAAAITGVALDSRRLWGVTSDPSGWAHFHIIRNAEQVYCGSDASADAGAKATAFATISTALREWSAQTLGTAVSLIESDALYRAEKVHGPVAWLQALQHRVSGVRGSRRDAIVWRAVAEAPEGFCHPRSGVAATLLDDIASGMALSECAERFAAKMRPDRYQRPQAPPKAGAIDAAERLFATLGLARALERRFARIEECVLEWQPQARHAAAGVFGVLRAPAAPRDISGATAITFAKFRRGVLPAAAQIEVSTPWHGNYGAIVTAVHSDALPILQWDREDCRNPASWYVYAHGSEAERWGLTPNAWVECTGITLNPAYWGTPTPNQQEVAFLLLRGARDNRCPGLALFPEILRGDLHGVRSVIEAYSQRGTMQGYDLASACGLVIGGSSGALVRVTDMFGVRRTYRIDRWE